MIEWDVLDEKPLPAGNNEEGGAPRVAWRRWLALLGALLLVVALTVWWQLRAAEGRLRQDIARAVLEEERALRFGIVAKAAELADPAAPSGWRRWYETTFVPPALPLPVPTVRDVTRDGAIALATLDYAGDAGTWQEVRAYRLVGQGWRRTPIPVALWGKAVAHRSDHFTLRMRPRDAASLPPDTLLTEMEGFYSALVPLWSGASGSPLTLQLEPDERLVQADRRGRQIRVRSPLLTPANPRPFLTPPRAYRFALAEAIAASFDSGKERGQDGARLSAVLRAALVRHLFLTEEEMRLFHAGLRQREVRGPEPSAALGEAEADYLLASQGAAAADQLMRAYEETRDLEEATLQAVGHPLRLLRYSAARWLESGSLSSLAREAGGTGRGRVMQRLTDQPLHLELAADDGATLSVKVAPGTTLPVPATCLAPDDELAFHIAAIDGEGSLVVDDVALLARHLDPWPTAPLPLTTHTLITREVGGFTLLLALDSAGAETELARLPVPVRPVAHPTEPRFAFLSEDSCGVVVNEYDPGTAQIVRTPLPLVRPNQLFWDDDRLLVVDNLASASVPVWHLYVVGKANDALGMYFVRQGEGQLLGSSKPVRSYIQRLDNTLSWVGVGIANSVESLPFKLPDNVEIAALSPDGRWLAYTEHRVTGEARLNALDLVSNRHVLLDTVAPNVAHGEMAWAPGERLVLAVVEGELGESRREGTTITRYQLSSPVNPLLRAPFPLDGEVDHLHWCVSGRRLLYRLTRAGRAMLVEGLTNDTMREVAAGDYVLWCRGP